MVKSFRRWALISVSNKKHLIGLARELIKNNIGIISTGGSAKTLGAADVPVMEVSDYTGHPEVMGGRVKTLHPKVHGGILGRSAVDSKIMEELGIRTIDFVVVNLYPFEETISKENVTFEDAIENIDIGGPALLRAAAKNHSRVTVVCDPGDYPELIACLSDGQLIPVDKRLSLAVKAFRHVAGYDEKIANYLASSQEELGSQFPFEKKISLERKKLLRYGENPHQEAALYLLEAHEPNGIAGCRQLAGKQLSFNNVVDADTANECVQSFSAPSCVIVKHANPCGVAESHSAEEAYNMAYSADSTSAFGGVIAFNRPVTEGLANQVLDRQFVEVIVAPKFDESSLRVFAKKENVRALELSHYSTDQENNWDMKSVSGGFLIQEKDKIESGNLTNLGFRVVTKRKPTPDEERDLHFAWKVAAFVKSNAIVFAQNGLTIGIGAGQMSRIYSARLAGMKAKDAGFSVSGAVMASDAFFPFRDGIDEAVKQGVTAVIQPGGSMRDEEVIEAANDNAITMVFTGRRHFKH